MLILILSIHGSKLIDYLHAYQVIIKELININLEKKYFHSSNVQHL